MKMKRVDRKLIEQNIEYLRKNMPSYDAEDEKRIYEFVLPLIEEGTTEENFRENATKRDPNWSGRDFFLFDLLIQPNLPEYIEETHKTVKEARKIILEGIQKGEIKDLPEKLEEGGKRWKR
jgi:hypothetical protein